MRGLAQDYTVVARVPRHELQATDPSLLRLPSGRLLASWAFRDHGGPGTLGWDAMPSERVRLATSSDEGASWQELPPIAANTGHPFLHRGRLHLLVDGHGRRDLMVTRSDDEGESWAPFVTLFEGSFWNSPSGTAVREGQWYLGFGVPNDEGRYNADGSGLVVLAADLGRDLLHGSAWRRSKPLRYPGTPASLGAGQGDRPDHWLEPNVVNDRENLHVLARCRIDHQATANLAAICDVEDRGSGKPKLTFRQFYPVPGGQGNFFVLHDHVSGLFWMLSNLPTDSKNTALARRLAARGFVDVSGGAGDERRFLVLSFSVDAFNWFNAGFLAMTSDPLQSFHYAAPLIDGEDLLFLSRTSRDAPNQHDSDLITFHRLVGFRRLAPPFCRLPSVPDAGQGQSTTNPRAGTSLERN
jgi:hypothetical protein